MDNHDDYIIDEGDDQRDPYAKLHKGYVMCECGKVYDASRQPGSRCPKCGKENRNHD